jgi:Uma2 family endonuclease
METDRHRRQMNLLIESLDHALRDRDDVFVGGNMFVYFSELQTKRNDFKGPDVFVVLGTVRRERKSWVVWKEDGRMPDVIIELVSESTEAIDRGEKMRLYARTLRVGEYYIYDPWTHRLDGYRLDVGKGQYEALEPLEGGDLPCSQLGLRLGIRHGKVADIETSWLRWLDRHGIPVPTPAEAASQRAEAEAQRAEAASQRAEAEAQRAGLAEARLAAYESKFGKLPDP